MAGNPYTKMFPVSWQELHRDAKALAWRLHGMRQWRALVAITRGGLVPAAIVARELDLRIIDTISVKSYDHQRIGGTEVIKRATIGNGDNAALLIVDDLVDTGATAKVVRELLPGAHLATVYAKPAGKPMVDTYVTEVSQDTWIMFPWDTELQIATPIAEGGRA